MALLLPFTETDLKVAAGPRSYDRGLDYLSQVRDLDFDGPEITATVYGSDTYEVYLTVGTGPSDSVVLVGDCSCPFGQEGNFCKHCVATGLAALRLAATRQANPAAHQQRDLLISWLTSLSKDELVAEILELLDSDRDLRRRVELRAAARQANVEQVRSAVQNLVYRDDYLDAAWIAADSGATQDQWIRLADASIPTRPADALAFYLKAITPLTGQTGDNVYHQIARLLLAARACHETLGTLGEFRQYLTVLRMSQKRKRKRNLMEILAANGLANQLFIVL